jgi:hypothetical protein
VVERVGNARAQIATLHTARLPKRDYIVLPLISLLTVLFMLGASEIFTRMVWTQQETNACFVRDPTVGNHFKSNCTSRTKNAEGAWTTYHFNECGYRSATSCGPKPAGSIRIVIVGSSVSMGLYIPYEQTYFVRISRELSAICNCPVDVQNMGLPGSGGRPIYTYRRVKEALALQPDVVLYVWGPWDLEQQMDPKELAERNNPVQASSHALLPLTLSPMERLSSVLSDSRTMLVAKHFLFQNKDAFLRASLMHGDMSDFLRQPFTPAWQQRFAGIDLIIGDMADKLRAAGVPLIVIPVPSRAQAALLSSREWPPHVDPFAFGHQVEMTTFRHRAGYVDLMGAFSRIPDSEQLFYPVDGHIIPDGQNVLAQSILRTLRDGAVPAISQCAVQQGAEREH